MHDFPDAPLLGGDLSGFALADVLQLLELGARTGVLVVDGGPIGGGRVWLRDGRIRAAAVDGSDAWRTGAVAARVLTLLELSAGRWAFHLADGPEVAADAARTGDGVRVSMVLVEAARLRDERTRGAAAPAPPEADVPQLADAAGADDAEVPAVRLTSVDLRVLAAVDGVRTASEIATAVRCDPAGVLGALGRLRAAGVVCPPRACVLPTHASAGEAA